MTFLRIFLLLISVLFLSVLPAAYLELYSLSALGPLSSISPDSLSESSGIPVVNQSVIGDVTKSLALLGIASSITVISLPSRNDRRGDMQTLLNLLGVPDSGWRYFDAVKSTDERVQAVMDWVRYIRSAATAATSPRGTRITWLDTAEIDKLVDSDLFLNIWHTNPWPSPLGSGSDFATSPLAEKFDLPPLISATEDFNFPPHSSPEGLPNHKLLTRARLACWFSHLEVIHQIANGPMHQRETAIVLEDDVDMESDIEEQLRFLWSTLPEEWDVVFLGHCWSNESYHPPLSPFTPDSIHTLHPAHKPKCTHAYALTRTGARRLLLHLRYPPFAFSRAIDQAIAWLVESGKLQGAFSVVPSLVVQRKVRESDVFTGGKGKGSRWRERLRKGVLETLVVDHSRPAA